MSSEDNNKDNNVRGVCSLVIRYIVTAVERRVAYLQGLVTDATTVLAQDTSVLSPSVTRGGKDNTPLASNVAKASSGQKDHH